MTKHAGPAQEDESASEMIDQRIAELGDWRGEMLSRVRALIIETVPDVLEEWKWMGTPVWSHGGIITTGESYKKVVKLTFAKGASLKDPAKLFNSSLDGNVRRAIDIQEGEKLNVAALKALILEAVALNAAKKAPAKVASKPEASKAKAAPTKKAPLPVKGAAKKTPAKKGSSRKSRTQKPPTKRRAR